MQAYQKRAHALIDWVADVGERTGRRLLVRLVKGAYWDTEIKLAQVEGLANYPVFTRKVNTDVSYLACAAKMLAADEAIYPCFATHNANTLAAVLEMAGNRRDMEFQRLHGMGDSLYETLAEGPSRDLNCRIYAPVGGHKDLLAYLVRRLLENGANTSFVNRIADEDLPLEDMARDHVETARKGGVRANANLPSPAALFGEERVNSAGLDLTDPDAVAALRAPMIAAAAERAQARPVVNGEALSGDAAPVRNPANRDEIVGEVVHASREAAKAALQAAAGAFPAWDNVPAAHRAAILRNASDLFEEHSPALMTRIVREAGRTVRDAHLEVREAVDFLRYYAAQAEREFTAPLALPGPTGETNALRLRGRGPFLCISPWNFPLAIFTGQIAAALAAGNPVLAKPAEQTPLIASDAVRLLHQAGVPKDVLHLLPGDGPSLGAAVMGEDALAGVAFTGSTATAKAINRALAAREGPIATLIAETGGVNAMLVDSTALPEQVTRDVLASSFQSAGQRCSALRLLLIQEDVAESQIAMIEGAMRELAVGDPADLATDVGPVIDEEAHKALTAYADTPPNGATRLASTPVPDEHAKRGLFVAPTLLALERRPDLKEEVFGPILHVARFAARDLDQAVADVNATGYGLTLGVHSRAANRVARIAKAARVGNVYVNRNQIGAVVGSQPFGGMGLSGTGPKAGGAHYLHRFAAETTLTTDTTAAGGNASLMAMDED